MTRVRRMAAEALHEWAEFGPPQIWMCNHNVANHNGVHPYSATVERMAKAEHGAIEEAEKMLGAGWLTEPEVRLVAIALLLEEP